VMEDRKKNEGEDGDGYREGAKGPLKSPGIDNSEVKGREFGFTSREYLCFHFSHLNPPHNSHLARALGGSVSQ